MKLDVGCGPKCLPEFVGVDRFSLPGVKVVADLDKPLPFEDNSIELIHAAHSLEHVSDLMFTMRELYRISKHKAQICIVAPYFEQKLNLANPYHLQVFNEHTPRFWTNFAWAPLDQNEYYHPHAAPWGLSESDHSNPGLDIRLLRMEFFYFPRFNRLDPSLQREMRQNLTDVCHQVAYHLVVWKDECDEEYIEMTKHLDKYQFLDTPALQKARSDAFSYPLEDSVILEHAKNTLTNELESRLKNQIDAQHDYIVECEKQLQRNDRLIKFLSGIPDLSSIFLGQFSKYLEKNYTSCSVNSFKLGRQLPSDGYIEYGIKSRGAYTSFSVCVYLESDTKEAKLGIEVIDKNNSILWSSLEPLSSVNTIGVVNFFPGKVLQQDDVAFVRFFGQNLNEGVNVLECSVLPRLPFRSSRLIPYACFTNDE